MKTLRRVNNSRYLDLEEKLLEFKNEKESHAKFYLNKIPGLMGRRGSGASDQNNFSLLVCFNDGNKKDHAFFADSHALMKKCYKGKECTLI